MLADAVAHHAWATLRVIAACASLPGDQLATTVPGTYGSILETIRHIVGADAGYLSVLTAGSAAPITEIDEASMDLAALRAATVRHGAAWAALLEGDLDPDVDAVRHRDDGTASHAPVGVRLAQALHHGTDHRSQICTALTSLGVEPPGVDVWAFAEAQGRIRVDPAPAEA